MSERCRVTNLCRVRTVYRVLLGMGICVMTNNMAVLEVWSHARLSELESA